MTLHQAFIVACVAWPTFLVIASLVVRRRRGLPILRPPLAGSRFVETWRSGGPHPSRFGPFGGAQNCLWVAVADDAIRIAPHFPFNLMFVPTVFDNEVTIPRDAVRSVEPIGGLLGKRVRIHFATPSGRAAGFDLYLADPAGFARAVDAMGRGDKTRTEDDGPWTTTSTPSRATN